MIGTKKLSSIRKDLRAAFSKEGVSPIAALERKLRKLKKTKPVEKESRALVMLRNALAQLVEDKARKRRPATRTKRPKKAV